MDVDLNRLRHILAVARTRSFSRAAEDLHITQPALSRSIAGFEQRFGMRLFDRDRAGVAPTAVGQRVIAEAERVVRAARDLDHNLRLYARGERGDLAIGVGPLLAMLLPAIGRGLLRTAPGLHLRASVRTPDHLVQELLDDRIEVIYGNSWAIQEIPDIDIRPLGAVGLAFMVRTGHPLLDRGPLLLRELSHFPHASAAGSSVGESAPGTFSFVCDNYHVLREVVLDSDCIWLASPAVLDADIAAGRLVALDVSDFNSVRSEVSVVQRRGRTLSSAVEATTALIRDMLEPLDS